MSTGSTQLRYMTRFRCIAERCEDTCCTGLRVPVSETQWQRMQAAVAGEPEEARHLHQCVSPHPEGGPHERAFIEMKPDGHCPLLDAQRLCSFQRRHGEEALPDICATFPRFLRARGEQVELTGTLACPEVARLCLLAEDAVEPVPLDPSGLWRVSRLRDAADASGLHAEPIREALLRLLDRREYPLASRLALLGQFAYALEEERDEGEERWREVLRRFDSPEVLEGLHQEFTTLELPGGGCVGLFGAVLEARLSAGRGERFDTFVRGVRGSLGLEDKSPQALDAAWRTYAERWRRIEALHGERLRQYFHHYAVHSLRRAPFTHASSLLAFVFPLALRVAMLRLTLMGHPQVAALLDAPSTPEARESLDAAAVETFQLMAKHVEQSPDFLSLASGLVGEGRGAQALGKVLVFATF